MNAWAVRPVIYAAVRGSEQDFPDEMILSRKPIEYGTQELRKKAFNSFLEFLSSKFNRPDSKPFASAAH